MLQGLLRSPGPSLKVRLAAGLHLEDRSQSDCGPKVQTPLSSVAMAASATSAPPS